MLNTELCVLAGYSVTQAHHLLSAENQTIVTGEACTIGSAPQVF